MTSLQTLSEPVRTRLRSTQILTSLPQVLSELVQNALDASASHLDIGIDCQEWECWVKDDGHGIPRSGLDVLTRSYEAGRYNTSKAYSLGSLVEVCTFGFRGEALASAADVSCLEISSRTSISQETWSVITKNGRCLYDGPSTRWRLERPGTVVYLRDIFYNLPIRRTTHSRPLKTMETICRDVETLALVFPGVSFTVSAMRPPSEAGLHNDRVLNIPKSSSILSAFRHIHGKTLAEEVDEIAVSSGLMKLEGFISLRGAFTKEGIHQYIYINHHPLSSSHHLHHAINHAFSNSEFSKRISCANMVDFSRRHTRRSSHRPDAKPIFVFSLSIPPADIDNCLEPGKSMIHVSNEDAITDFVNSVIHTFLLRHRFLVNNEDRSTRQKRRKMFAREEPCRDRSGSPASISTPSGARASSQMQPIIATRDNALQLHVHPDRDNDDENDIVWTDPTSGATFLVDKKTGHSYPRTSPWPSIGEDIARTMNAARRTIDSANSGNNEGQAPQWILDALKDNCAYFVKEEPIPAVSQRLPTIFSSEHIASAACGTYSSDSLAFTFDETSTWGLKRGDLSRMKVINQLDRKFIVCVLDVIGDSSSQTPDLPKRMLVLVDQHAASERVRVEGFLKTLCHHFLCPESSGSQNAFLAQLNPPRPILLSRREACILCRDTNCILRRWGFDLSWQESESRDQNTVPDAYEQVLVHSIPQVAGEKILVGDELRHFLRNYATELETSDVLPALGSEMLGADQDGPVWHKALRWCPRSLLEIVNSRACRGAIMFNDTLSLEQCERLMSQLAETAFPFQCAHGRPSLVPLSGISECASGKGRRPKVDWARGGSELALSSGDGMVGVGGESALGEPVTSSLPRNNIRGAGAAES